MQLPWHVLLRYFFSSDLQAENHDISFMSSFYRTDFQSCQGAIGFMVDLIGWRDSSIDGVLSPATSNACLIDIKPHLPPPPMSCSTPLHELLPRMLSSSLATRTPARMTGTILIPSLRPGSAGTAPRLCRQTRPDWAGCMWLVDKGGTETGGLW